MWRPGLGDAPVCVAKSTIAQITEVSRARSGRAEFYVWKAIGLFYTKFIH